MSKLKEKSNFNIDAAEILIENSLYAPSVHCSYYSCFQLLKYSMNDFFEISYNKLSVNIATSPMNTHKYIVEYINSQLKNNKIENNRWFYNSIKDLKHFREESDYDNLEINLDKSTRAFDMAKNIRVYLTQNFNL